MQSFAMNSKFNLSPKSRTKSLFFAMDVLERVIVNPKGCDVSTAREELKATLTQQIGKTRDFILKSQLALEDYQDCYQTARALSTPKEVLYFEEEILKSYRLICVGLKQLNYYEARLARVDTL